MSRKPAAIRLYTDAGVRYGVGTWATVIVRDDREPVEAYGRLRESLKCSATAELRAIANALHKMVAKGELATGDRLDIFTDSVAAVQWANGAVTKRKQSKMANASKVIRSIAKTHGLTIRAHWVRGHQPDSASEHAPFNNRCDELCRLARDLPEPAPLKSRAARHVAAVRRLMAIAS